MGRFIQMQGIQWKSFFFVAVAAAVAPLKAHENPPSGPDPSFVYSQSFAFEYDERPQPSHPTSFDHHHLPKKPPPSSPRDQEFHIVYASNESDSSHNSPSPTSTWVSRVEQEFQADAYAFEASIDSRLFSEEEMEKQYEDQSDDDDDNDNDGSCSMLSNAAISRVKVVTHQDAPQQIVPTAKIRGGAQPRLQSPSRSVFQSRILTVREGAGARESVGSEVLKRLFVSALVTLLYEGSVGHIFEFLKIVMQTSPHRLTYGAVIGDITAEKGLGGLWDGFVPWGVVQAVSKGAVFGMAHTSATRLLMPLAENGVLPTMMVLTMAGGIGGGVRGYVLSPILLLKTRVMTNPVFRKKLSLWETSVLSASVGLELVRTEGVRSLMKGANIFATKRVFDWATRFYFAEMIEALFRHLKSGGVLSLGEKSISSFLGGVLSTVVTLPLDVLVAKAQDAKKAGVKVSAFKLFTDELHEKGLGGLADAYLNGFAVRLIHVCLTVVVMKTLAPVVYDALFG